MDIFTSVSLLLIIAGVMGLLATKTRQPLIVAYILTGVICGPAVLQVLKEVHMLQELSHTGIALLLFLAGLELHPQKFMKQLLGLVHVTLGACLVNTLLVMGCTMLLGYTWIEGAWVGVALMFSSTLLFIKLIPKITEDQKRINSFCLSVLIIEDIIAVLILMLISLAKGEITSWWQWSMLPVYGVAAVAATFIVERYILRGLISSIRGRYEETKILMALSWCLAVALLFKYTGFSMEIGAFVAGMALSQAPEAKEIEEGLIFLRDFFLILFFVTLGAEIDFYLSQRLLLPVLLIAGMIIVLKPSILQLFFSLREKNRERRQESSIRLGQSSEFGLLISLLAQKNGLISVEVSKLIQLVVIFTLIFSSSRIFYTYRIHPKQKSV